MKELLILPFYLIYLAEWIIGLFRYKGKMMKSYYSISFEREAYRHENDKNYIINRRRFSQWR